MSIERSEPVEPGASADPSANGANGHPPGPPPVVEWQKRYFAAQIAKLRHWCRDLLDTSPAAATLPADVLADLRDTLPGMSLDEVFAAFHRQRNAGLSKELS